jgi:hypothetical protein
MVVSSVSEFGTSEALLHVWTAPWMQEKKASSLFNMGRNVPLASADRPAQREHSKSWGVLMSLG